MDLSLAGDLFMWSSGLNNHFYLGWTDSSFLENGRIISVVCPRVFYQDPYPSVLPFCQMEG